MLWVLIFLQKLLQTVYTGELQVGEHPIVNSFVLPVFLKSECKSLRKCS